VLPTDSVVSAITLAELSVDPHVARTAKERVARQAHDFEGIEGLEVRAVPHPAS
jgi:tRNA(fMet)-specific endonuclease VapC